MMRRALIAAALATLVAIPACAAAASVEMMVVGRTKTLLVPHEVKLRAGKIRIGHRHCSVPAGTALSGLLSARLATRVTDVAGCDPASMFVTKVRHDANHGAAGWEYKVGHSAPSFGAGDPAGRLRSRAQLLWFWCLHASACQRTLAVTVHFSGGVTQVHVAGYDDNGHGRAVSGATVHIGTQTVLTNSHGGARASLAPGHYQVYATKTGMVRSFTTEVGVVA